MNDVRELLNIPEITYLGPVFTNEFYFSYVILSCGLSLYVYFDRVEILYIEKRYTFSHVEFLSSNVTDIVNWLCELKEMKSGLSWQQ